MNKEDAYILQKDSPNCKAGTEFRFVSLIMKYQSTVMNKNSKGIYFEPEDVENNPEWFKIKEEEKPKVINIEERHNVFLCRIHTIGKDVRVVPISKEHLAEILIAYSYGNLIINGNKEKGNQEKLYTEKEWLQFGQECFEVARNYLYHSFSDYMNDLKK